MLHGKRNFTYAVKAVVNLKIGEIPWIIQVGPVESHEPGDL